MGALSDMWQEMSTHRCHQTRGEGYHSAVHEMLEGISQSDLSPAEAVDEERVAKIGAANAYAAGADTVSRMRCIVKILTQLRGNRPSRHCCRSSWRWRSIRRFKEKRKPNLTPLSDQTGFLNTPTEMHFPTSTR